MSLPVTLEPRAARDAVPRTRRFAARAAVAAAFQLRRCRPQRLRGLLELVSRGARPATSAEAMEAREAVVAVSVHCAGQGCLERSIATFLLCRLSGRVPEWRTGVRLEPFRAHAWVAVGGVPVGEHEEVATYAVTMGVR
ncbi:MULTISPECIES: lasso peptide biosynthesis B2 protein [Streptomyces]|uniref:Lasso peptide biosynthesis B2 protein n=2 Tax=Streptomyces TaxID=1883 RepID=A0A7X6HXV7_9ACTN|nr:MULTISPECIES: lasso peptide biosynthesis B2 protein [Streptomyces]NJQ04948.1 lasso peptide biosynthesis B2 protein [Streptomyces lonarensis]NJQ13627.1 lasso peptide biosynthesis B2 protein [Streptomyces bohaiensis]